MIKLSILKTFTEKMIKQEINNYFTILQILAKIFLGLLSVLVSSIILL